MDKKAIKKHIAILRIKRNRPFGSCYRNAIDSNIAELENLLDN